MERLMEGNIMLDNKISIEFQSLSQNEGFARVAVSAFIA